MGIQSKIMDGGGGSDCAKVDANNNLCVSPKFKALEPEGSSNRVRFYAAKFGTTGADSGTVNANVDGSATAQTFCIASQALADIYLMRITLLIADTAVAHNNFGNVGALSNGITLRVVEQGNITNIITAAKTGGQVIAQAGFYAPYGDAATTWELSNWTGTEDAQTIAINIGDLVPGGIRLGRASQDKIELIVNDDLTGLTEFTVRGLGYTHHS